MRVACVSDVCVWTSASALFCLHARARTREHTCMPVRTHPCPIRRPCRVVHAALGRVASRLFFTACNLYQRPRPAVPCRTAPHRTTLHCTARWHKKYRTLSVVSRLRQIVRHRRRVRCYALWHACMIVYVQCCAGSCRDMLRCGRCAACMCTQARMWQASMSRPHRCSSRSMR